MNVLLTLAYFLPSVLMLSIPAALMLGASLGLSRLERDRELLALRMGGVQLKRIVLPVIMVALFASVGMFYLQEELIPQTTHKARQLANQLMNGTPTAFLQQDSLLRVDADGATYFIYVRLVDPNPEKQMLRGVMVMRVTGVGNPMWMTIPLAENVHGVWSLQPDPITHEPIHYYFMPGNELIQANASGGDWQPPQEIFSYFSNQPASAEEMTLRQLQSCQKSIRGGTIPGYNVSFSMDPQHLTFYIQRKIAAPLAALVAVLIAIPLSVHFGRSGGYIGLLLSAALAFFFVITQQWMQVLAETSRLHPVIAAWAPNAFYGILGIILLLKEE